MLERYLFRGKRIYDNSWVEGAYFAHGKRQTCPFGDELKDEDVVHLIVTSGFADWNMPRPIDGIPVNASTVGQCSGMKDKNGKLIFEGDIVRASDHKDDIFQVCFGEFPLYEIETETAIDMVVGWHTKLLDADPMCMIAPFCYPCSLFSDAMKQDMFEVIGNIHDNPKLLEVAND